MHSRRAFLRRGTAGTAAVATGISLAGCFDDDGGDNGNDDGDRGDRFYDALADPDPVAPRYFVGYDYDVTALLDLFEPSEIMPQAAGALFENVISELDNVGPDAVDRIVASRYRQIGSAGSDEFNLVGPEGEGLHATGEFDADPFVSYFSDLEISDLGSYEDYRRFGVTREEGAEAVGIDDGSYVFGERISVPDIQAASVIDTEIDAVQDRSGAVRDILPEFVVAADLVDADSLVAAAQYDLVTLGADSGVEAFDDAVTGLSSTVIGASLGASTDIERGLVYVDEEYADVDAVEAALAAGVDGEGPVDEPDADWTTEQDGRTVIARATVEESAIEARPGFLHAPLPVPGYHDMFEPVDPSAIGRDPVPRAALEPQLQDGRILIEHVGGQELETLSVRYVADGEQQDETWEGPVAEGDEFQTSEQVDVGTDLFVVWQPETVNAAIILRVNVPE